MRFASRFFFLSHFMNFVLYSGDIRSRLVRLIPTSPDGSPLERIRNLLAYRLPPTVSEREARDEWRDIVEGKSALWNGIPLDRKEVIRGMRLSFSVRNLQT